MFKHLTIAAALALSVQTAAAQDWSKLIGPAELAALQSAGDPLVIDIRAASAEGNAPSYAAGHIAGAVSAPYGRWRGPKENPGAALTDEALTELLQSIGATPERPTVVVHQGANGTDFGAAARVYWTLKSAGVARIAILNGGVNAWTASERALSTEAAAPARSAMVASLSPEWMATREEVAAVIAGETSEQLLDARPARQYLGLSKHKAASAAGTLPGARNFSQAEWFQDDETLMSPADQAALIAQTAGLSPEEPVISFCNTGHWAATNWFALSELAGREDVKLYPGSMVEWSTSGGALDNRAAR